MLKIYGEADIGKEGAINSDEIDILKALTTIVVNLMNFTTDSLLPGASQCCVGYVGGHTMENIVENIEELIQYQETAGIFVDHNLFLSHIVDNEFYSHI